MMPTAMNFVESLDDIVVWRKVKRSQFAVNSSPKKICELYLLRTANHFLKVQFQPKLHTARRIELIGDSSKSTAGDIAVWGIEDHTVENVEKLPAEIHLHAFCEEKRFLQRGTFIEIGHPTGASVEAWRLSENRGLVHNLSAGIA